MLLLLSFNDKGGERELVKCNEQCCRRCVYVSERERERERESEKQVVVVVMCTSKTWGIGR